jgi:hypothetical protein
MDKFQAAFEVLCLLSMIDGDMDSREVSVINTYINDNFGKGNYDSRNLARSLSMLTPQGRLEELGSAAAAIQRYCTGQEKLGVLDFALNLVMADGCLTDPEANAFVALGTVWDIDVKRFIDQRMR